MFRTFFAIARLISTVTTDPACELYPTSKSIDRLLKATVALGNGSSDEAQRRGFFLVFSFLEMLSKQFKKLGSVL
jgi:hypothetical protein